MCDISVREYIRWLPDESSEPTSTIVLTTPERRFVDVRILKPTSSEGASGESAAFGPPALRATEANMHHAHGRVTPPDVTLPLSRLDWAIAGTSSSRWLPSSGAASGKGIKRSQWHHWIDSRTENAEEVVDEGDTFDHPSDPSLSLERGRMLNPDTGAEIDYEEVWRSEPVETVAGGVVSCFAMQREADEDSHGPKKKVKRGLLVRLGQYCQAFARDGHRITVERWKWDANQMQWNRLVRIGQQELPTEFATHLAHQAQVDDEVKVGGEMWKVVERS